MHILVIKESKSISSNGSFGGKIITTSENASLNFTGNMKSTYRIVYSTNSPYYYDSNMSTTFKLLKDGVFEERTISSGGIYYSTKVGTQYGFYATSAIISYNTNGGTPSSYSQKTVTIPSGGYTISNSDIPGSPSKQYYTFVEWRLDGSTALNQTIWEGVQLDAYYTPNTYNINYVDVFNYCSGGTTTYNNETTFNYETNRILNNPSNGNLVFGGWYTDSSLNNKILSLVGSNVIGLLNNNALTLYASWFDENTESYTIYFNNDSNAISCPDSDTIVASSGFSWNNYTLPVMTGKDNDKDYEYYFDGWYNGSTKITSINSSLFNSNNELTLTAHYLLKNTLVVKLSGVEGSLKEYYYKPGMTFTVPQLSQYGINVPSGSVFIQFNLYSNPSNSTHPSAGSQVTLTDQTTLELDIRQYITLSIGSNDYTTITVTLTSGSGYIVTEGSDGASATAFSNQTKGNGTTTLITVGSQFKAKYTAGSSGSDHAASVSGVSGITALTTSDQTLTAGTNNITITPTATAPSCLLPNTLVYLQNGEIKMIQDLVPGDIVIVFNHETGKLDIAPVTFNESEAEQWFNVIYLEFDNGKQIGVISEHGFFDLNTMQYEYIDEYNYSKFIGHRFYTINGNYTTLINAYMKEEYTSCYSLPSYYHLNLFTEDILSMPGGIKGLFNIFEYDDNLQYNQELMQQDIETYGLFTIEEFAEWGVTEEMFYAYAGQYLKVALGKGILTEEYLMYLIQRYGQYTD